MSKAKSKAVGTPTHVIVTKAVTAERQRGHAAITPAARRKPRK